MEIGNIEEKICLFFGVSLDELYSREIARKVSNARHYLWYILHYDFGMSNGQIAKRYDRTKRAVIMSISDLRFRVVQQREDRNIYNRIKKIL